MDKVTALGAYIYSLLPGIDKLNGQFWSTLIGAVVGAVVGGLITLAIQLSSIRHARKQEAAAQEKRELATATSMLLKAAKMFSTISHIDTHMRATVELAKQHKCEANPPWQMVQPMVGKTPEIIFTDDERMLAVVDMPKDFIAVLEMPDIHNSLIDLVDEYSKRRIELGSLMPAVSHQGMLATTDLTAEEYQRLTPRMLNLQSLVVPMIDQSVSMPVRIRKKMPKPIMLAQYLPPPDIAIERTAANGRGHQHCQALAAGGGGQRPGFIMLVAQSKSASAGFGCRNPSAEIYGSWPALTPKRQGAR